MIFPFLLAMLKTTFKNVIFALLQNLETLFQTRIKNFKKCVLHYNLINPIG